MLSQMVAVECALVEDADGDKRASSRPANKRESTKKVRLMHGTRAERAGSVQI